MPVQAALTAQLIFISWSGDSGPHIHHAMVVVFLIAPYRRTIGESWKEPVRQLPLVLFIAKLFQSPQLESLLGPPSWASGHLQLPYWVSRDKTTQDKNSLRFVLPYEVGENPNLGILLFHKIYHSPRSFSAPLPRHSLLCRHIQLHTGCPVWSTLYFIAVRSCNQTQVTFKQ